MDKEKKLKKERMREGKKEGELNKPGSYENQQPWNAMEGAVQYTIHKQCFSCVAALGL
jgi:hypothetical protein